MKDNSFDQEEAEEFFEHFRLVVDKGQQLLRVDKFLAGRMQNVSRNRIQNSAKAECIRVNDVAVKSNYKVKPDDVVTVVMPHPPRDTEVYPEDIPLNIVYEDEYLLVVNKKAGMVVHPGYNNYNGTLVNALVHHFDQLPTANGERRPGLVHRIDKDTTGLLLIAKDEYTMTHLAKQFFEHSVDRSYLALVWGRISEEKGTIDQYLARSQKDRRVMQVYPESELAKRAITHYTVQEKFLYTTLIECRLETGRTHQIRAHMQHIGHPIFSDSMYGGDSILLGPAFTKYKQFVSNCFELCPRQALHARSIGFTHPNTGERMNFTAALPDDMEALTDKWRRYTGSLSMPQQG